MNRLDIDELEALLKHSPETIPKDLKRNPLAAPPRLHIPVHAYCGDTLKTWRLGLLKMSR